MQKLINMLQGINGTLKRVEKIEYPTKKPVIFEDKDYHCMARIIQSAAYSPNESIFYRCSFCKYKDGCMPNRKPILQDYDVILEKLQCRTSVNMEPCIPRDIEKKFKNYI